MDKAATQNNLAETFYWPVWIIFAVTQLLLGCGKTDQTPMPPPKPNVVVSQPIAEDIVEWDEFTGRLQAVDSVEIRSRVSGYLKQILFKDGSKVNKGDLLFIVDPRPYLAQYHQAKSELDRAKSRQELAKNDLERAERLLKQHAISEEEFDSRSKTLYQANSSIESAKAAVELTELNVDFTEIRAPISGHISQKLLTEGNLVAADNTILANLVSTDPIYVYVEADERSILKYRRLNIAGKRISNQKYNLPLEMELLDEHHFPHKGYLDYVDPQMNPNTGTVKIRGVFSNPDDLLEPGLFARLRVPGGDHNKAILIDDKAIAMDQGKKFVMLANASNHAEYRQIETGRLYKGLRIVTNGLTDQDWVITTGLQFVRPGIEIDTTRKDMLAQSVVTGTAK